jgi:hypothetical protein
MIKKIVLSFLFMSSYCVEAHERFYAFIMHATHDENYDHFTWQKSVELFNALRKQCDDTVSDKSFEAFMANVDGALKTIQNIFDLYKNKCGLNIYMQIHREPFECPSNGLFISIDSENLEATPLENYEEIKALLFNAEKNNGNYPDNILDVVRPVLELSFGEIGLNVNIYE